MLVRGKMPIITTMQNGDPLEKSVSLDGDQCRDVGLVELLRHQVGSVSDVRFALRRRYDDVLLLLVIRDGRCRRQMAVDAYRRTIGVTVKDVPRDVLVFLEEQGSALPPEEKVIGQPANVAFSWQRAAATDDTTGDDGA
jgi:hypothetical protein